VKKRSEKMNNPIAFACPRCKQTFEFDMVGENEFVPCPICGTEFMTIRKEQKLLLEAFEIEPKTEKLQGRRQFTIEMPC
jgi:transcription initiation factor IIE alpha subunit